MRTRGMRDWALLGLPALLEFAYLPIAGGAAAYTFSAWIEVDP